jgi:lactoylglutathione lyase
VNLNHLNLTVTDVQETYKFLETYFGMEGKGGSNNIAFLTDENGMILTLTSMKLGKETEVKYPASFHIGFCQPGEEAVNENNGRLKEDGYDVPEPSRQHGSWTFDFAAPGGFTIEVLTWPYRRPAPSDFPPVTDALENLAHKRVRGGVLEAA